MTSLNGDGFPSVKRKSWKRLTHLPATIITTTTRVITTTTSKTIAILQQAVSLFCWFVFLLLFSFAASCFGSSYCCCCLANKVIRSDAQMEEWEREKEKHSCDEIHVRVHRRLTDQPTQGTPYPIKHVCIPTKYSAVGYPNFVSVKNICNSQIEACPTP